THIVDLLNGVSDSLLYTATTLHIRHRQALRFFSIADSLWRHANQLRGFCDTPAAGNLPRLRAVIAELRNSDCPRHVLPTFDTLIQRFNKFHHRISSVNFAWKD